MGPIEAGQIALRYGDDHSKKDLLKLRYTFIIATCALRFREDGNEMSRKYAEPLSDIQICTCRILCGSIARCSIGNLSTETKRVRAFSFKDRILRFQCCISARTHSLL